MSKIRQIRDRIRGVRKTGIPTERLVQYRDHAAGLGADRAAERCDYLLEKRQRRESRGQRLARIPVVGRPARSRESSPRTQGGSR